jgi:hypothetical protein
MALAKADSLLLMEILNCISEAYRLALLRESSFIISDWVSFSLENGGFSISMNYIRQRLLNKFEIGR